MLKIDILKWDTAIQAHREFKKWKYNKVCAYILWWLWLYRLYTREYWLFVLFLIALALVIPGVIRWIIDWFKVSWYVNKKNEELDDYLYSKYTHE